MRRPKAVAYSTFIALLLCYIRTMKTAVITGTSSGLGEAFALYLLQQEWKVYGISRRTNQNLTKYQNFVQIELDLSKSFGVEKLITTIKESALDLLVNNAGMCLMQPSEEWNDQTYGTMFGVHYVAPVRLLAALCTKLKNGQVVTILSDATNLAWPGFGLYGASKAALMQHMRSFAIEHPEINVINIHPESVDTPMTDTLGEEAISERYNYMKIKDISTVFGQIIAGALKIPSGSSVFLYNDWQKGDISLLNKEIYLYNVDTESMEQLGVK